MGSFSILNNIGSINSQNQLNINNVNLARTLTRLSSGKRINSGADDAAGLQIADSLKANVYALNQAVRNANDGISVAQIADGALQEVTNLLTRAVTLAEEAATGTVDLKGREALDKEFQSIQAEIARIATATNFNGNQLFAGNVGGSGGQILKVFVGDISMTNGALGGSIGVTIGKITANATTGKVDGFGDGTVGNLAGTNLLTDGTAADALGTLKTALNAVSTMRGTIGAGMNRLQSAIAVIQTQSQNTQAAESTLRDANIAEEISNLTRQQILSQSGMAALAQANSNSQSVLSLLR